MPVPYGNCLYKGLENLKYSAVCVCVWGGGRGAFATTSDLIQLFVVCWEVGFVWGGEIADSLCSLLQPSPYSTNVEKRALLSGPKTIKHEEIFENALNSPC